MAVTFVAAGTLAVGTGDITITMPAGLVTDDIVLLLVAGEGDGTYTTPAGYTIIAGMPVRSTNSGINDKTSLAVYWKIAGAAEGSVTYTDLGAQTFGISCAFRGIDTSAPIHAQQVSSSSTNSTSGVATGASSTAADYMAVVCTSAGDNISHSAWTNANLTSITQGLSVGDNTGSDNAIGMAYGIFPSTGSMGDTTFTMSASEEQANVAILLAFVDTVDGLTADDLQSASQVSKPAIGLKADDLQSASQLSKPVIEQEHALLADDLQSASQLSKPTAAHIHDLTADDLQSASQVSKPTSGGEHVLLADDLQSASQNSKPTSGGENALLADDLQSASQLSKPEGSQAHVLTADDLQSASQVSKPDVSESNILLADNLQSASQLSQPVLGENAIVLIPDADDSVGSWTTHANATINLYQQIDESTPNDSDYVRSELAPSTSKYKARLSDPSETPDAGGNHIIRYRYRKDDINGQTINLTVRLVQGASTIIASWSHTDIGATVVQAIKPLSSPEIASITNYNDLFLEFEANAP